MNNASQFGFTGSGIGLKRMNVFSLVALLIIGALLGMPACSSSTGALPAAEASRGLQAPPSVPERIEVKEFNDLVRGSSSDIYDPSDLTVGPDGALWVLDNADPDYGESAVVRISTSGKTHARVLLQRLLQERGVVLGRYHHRAGRCALGHR
ncbi:MAG TPA: hypothetical protein VGG51_00025 [Candidatus Cybelea sp.]|jgi:hypothetical protein